ncbi:MULTISPECIES: TIGR04283 family arsenosugar biosynthesis glycosyltransferase [Methylomonas]|uniref:Glycosyl transferase n=2 Tax=Methylomonas TaxID=416 RepID=A0A126T2Q3_9GAMM|nr:MULTISPECIES: TIGR04283 family arsenosugar biosynthesis glycosyltransferase [Methylomonas]AMK76371.1 glycosyl transferase [Methylomonas denitrificans]OAI00511.1 glycosyl transferase [Methylomonas methanica]TCV88398.1 rSAM/selenodomain-associated transferase 2 [Methylomonas methanica]
MMPQISIIIPVVNEAAQLTDKLRALQPLRTRCELLLVDGGSSDTSPAIAEPLVDQVLHRPRGRARQMNLGAQHAQADVLLFLHADTQLPDQSIDLIMSAVEQGAVWGRFDVRFDSQQAVFKLIAWMMNLRSRLTGIATGDQAIFVSRQAFQAVGGFPDIALMEDIAVSAALKKLAKPCCLKAKVVTSARRWQQHGILKTILLMWRLRLRYFFGAHPDDLAARYYRRQ